MNIEATRQRFNNIFQVKINETNLSKIINQFNTKLAHLESILSTLDHKIHDQIYSKQYQARIQNIIAKQTQHKFINIHEKINDQEKDIQRLEYSFSNYNSNKKKQLENIQFKLEEHNYRMFQISNWNEMKYSQVQLSVDSILKQVQDGRNKFQGFSKEMGDKFQEIQDERSGQFTLKEEIERLQGKFNEFRDQSQARLKQVQGQKKHVQVKKDTGFKPQGPLPKDKDGQNALKKAKFINKNITHRNSMNCTLSTNRNSNFDESSSFQLLFEHKALKQKIQIIQENIFILSQALKGNQKLDSINSIECIQIPKKFIAKGSRFNKATIQTHHSVQHNDQRASFDHNGAQIKAINEKIKKIEIKNDINDENYNNMLQKIYKLNHLESKVQSKIQEAQRLRVDLNTINQINSKFKKISSLLEIQQTKYVLQKAYTKDIEGINKIVESQTSMLHNMAKKQQIKQAIIFLQNKIKQIVIILTKKYEDQKVGAITRVQNVKCLTCSKDCSQMHLNRQNKTSHMNRFIIDKMKKESFKRIRTNQETQPHH